MDEARRLLMCRALGYLGPPIRLATLLHVPDNALIRQAVDPKYLHMLNLAGFGMMSWNQADDDRDEPLTYHSTTVPVFDANLVSLAAKVSTTCALAHVRGIEYRADSGFGEQNLHPFRYRRCRLAMAHNGHLAGFSRMKVALADRVREELRVQVRGTTDSEWVYALLLSQLADAGAWSTERELLTALDRTLRILRELRQRAGIDTSSALNLFLSDGRMQLAVRFTFDFGRYPLEPDAVDGANSRFLSLWFTTGHELREQDGRWSMAGAGDVRTAILASEPLTADTTGWLEVPEYSAVLAIPSEDGLILRTTELDA